MERVRLPVIVDRTLGSNQGLPHDLAPKDSLADFVGAAPAEDVHLDGFKIEQVEKFGDRTRHTLHYGGHVGKTARSPIEVSASALGYRPVAARA